MTRRLHYDKRYLVEGIDLIRLQSMMYRLHYGATLDDYQRRDLAERMEKVLEGMVEL